MIAQRVMRATNPNPPKSADRHLRAVEQTVLWAKEAAAAGNYQDALSWLRVLEVTEGGVPLELVGLRDHCQSIVHRSAALHQAQRTQRAQAVSSWAIASKTLT